MIEVFFKNLGTLKIAAIWISSNPSRASYIQGTERKRSMYELNELELDAVAGGAANGGLIAIDVQNVLNNNNVDVTVPISVRDVNVGVAAAVAVLGAAGAAVGQI
jgi:hypothetical protein